MPRLEDLPPVEGVTHRYADIGGVRLHVAEAGSGPPLLLVHGWPQHWWAWRHLIPRLADRHRVLAVDLRGWGWSDAPPGDYAKTTFAADLVAFLDAEGIDRVTVMSHDWGGYASFLLALEHPERVERLVALDIAPPWRTPPHPGQLLTPFFLSYQFAISTPYVGERLMTRSTRFVRTIMRAGSGRAHRWTDEEVAAFARVLQEPARARASVACYRTFLAREVGRSGHRPSDLRVPTLLVLGGESFIGRIARPAPTDMLRVETIPGAGHFLPEEAPDEVLRLAGL